MRVDADATRDWLIALAAPELEADSPIGSLTSPKSRLQEHTQRTTGSRPVYNLLDASGPDHDKVFRIEVSVEGEVLGRGMGPSRRVAETAAAAEAIETLRRRRSGPLGRQADEPLADRGTTE